MYLKSSLTVLTLAAFLASVGCSTVLATSDNTAVHQPGKTRAEVAAEVRAAQAAGTLNQPDYYPVSARDRK